jgi:parallel beta-helix repeat protein
VTKIAQTPVLADIHPNGHVLVSPPSGIDPQKFNFARVPVDALNGDLDLSHALLDDLAGGGSIAAPGSNVRDYGAKGDGVTDDTAALNVAIATGLPLYFPPGTYLTGPLTVAQSLTGAGNTSIIKAKPGTSVTASPLITQTATSGASISNLKLDGANRVLNGIYCPGTATQAGLRFERLEVCNVGDATANPAALPAGINVQIDPANLTSKQGIVVHECYIHDIYGDGMAVGGTGCIVSDNTIVHVGSAGIGSGTPMTDGVISNNTVYDCGWHPGIQADGISGYDYRNLRVLIIGNTVEKSGNHGIHFGGNSIQIIGNKCYDYYAHGVLLQSSPNATPTPGASGIISGNELTKASAGSGIQVGYFSQVIVSNNTITNVYAQGMVLTASPDAIVSGNIINGTTAAGADGIRLTASCNSAQITHNRIANVAGKAINDQSPFSTGLRVRNNIITAEGQASANDLYLEAVGTGAVQITGNTNVGTTAASNNLSVNGALKIGNATFANPGFNLDGANATTRFWDIKTAGLNRWRTAVGPGNETGTGNSGSDYALTRYADDGVTGFGVLSIRRSDGMTSLTSGILNIGSNTFSNPNLNINGAKQTSRYMDLQTAGVRRWRMTANATDETGSDVGSDFEVIRSSDAGATLGVALSIKRSTGAVTHSSGISAFGATPPTTKPVVSGAKGSNAALASLLTALAAAGFITDSTTA